MSVIELHTENTFSDLLNGIKGAELAPEDVPLKTIRGWASKDERSRQASYCRGYLVGRALLAQKPARGIEKWAKSIGLTPQMVGIYIRGYQAIEAIEAENQFSIPADLYFTGWVKTIGTGKPAKIGAPTTLKGCQSALSRFTSILEATPLELLREAGIQALYERLGRLLSGEEPGEDLDDDDDAEVIPIDRD